MISAIAALLAFVAAGVGAIVMVRRRPADPVTQFRRQIDALSAESRRSVITERSSTERSNTGQSNTVQTGPGSTGGPTADATTDPTHEPTAEPVAVDVDVDEADTDQPSPVSGVTPIPDGVGTGQDPVADDVATENAPGGS